MPEMHGLKVLEWIRSQPEFRSTVVIVLSSSRLTGDIQLAYKLGSNSYLVKPPTLEMLYQTVAAIAQYWLALNQWPEDPFQLRPAKVTEAAPQPTGAAA